MRKTLAAIAVFALLASAAPVNADAPITVSVWPTTTSKGNARLKVLLERNDANRLLTWEVDGPNYYRSSTAQLNGSEAPRSWFFFTHDLPEGRFEIRATVTREDKSTVSARTQMVVTLGR